MTKLYLEQIEIGPMQNFIYLVGDKASHECVIIDPAWDVRSVLQRAEDAGMKVVGGLLTHTHYDHCNGVEDLIERAQCRIYVHEKEAGFLRALKPHVQRTKSGFKIRIGNMEVQCIHTPGHSRGSQCFLMEGHLFSGDTLFVGTCGRCDLPGGDSAALYRSLQTLAALDDKIIVLPGHHYADELTSTIGKERRENPYYQNTSLEDFLSGRMGY